MTASLRIVLICAALTMTGPTTGAASPEPAAGAAQTIVHLLDYVAVDYAEAVADGKIKSADEFREMQEFTRQVANLVKSLPPVTEQDTLTAQAAALRRDVDARTAATDIAAQAGRLRWAVIAAYGIEVAPRAAPSLAAGATLYQSLCAGCHGVEGQGDGPAGAKLDPPPASFHDAARMSRRSPYGLYNTISLGVAGTGMAAYGQLSDEERWALAYYVAGLPLKDLRPRGESAWRSGEFRSVFPGISAITTVSAADVRERHGPEAIAVWAWLLANPQALTAGKPDSIRLTLARLAEAVAAYRSGDQPRARKLAITAYLEGFELAEASLRNVDAPLVRETEREMLALRGLIEKRAALNEVERQHSRVAALLERAHERLAGEGLSPGAALISSLVILLREGLEAILVLAAIIAFLVKAGRRDALPYVHAGWGSALVLGALTWAAAAYLIEVSGASREVTEGVTALIAAAMLVYVGIWLHNRAHAHAWQRFVKEQVGAALGKGTLWAMAAVSFLAVYREFFEVVLFYQALWAQTGAAARQAVVAGIAAACVALAATGWAIFRYSLRLPIGPFFTAMSLLLALMAVVLAGNGTAALQEAGVLGTDPVAFMALPLLGIYPTLQTLAAQAAVLAVLAASFWLARPGNSLLPRA